MSASVRATRTPATRSHGVGQPVDLGACPRWPRRRRTLLRQAVQPHAPRRSATGGLMRLLEGAIAALKRKAAGHRAFTLGSEVVARGGVEPPTFRFSVGRSYQLSYLALVAPRIRGAREHLTGAFPAGRNRRLPGRRGAGA